MKAKKKLASTKAEACEHLKGIVIPPSIFAVTETLQRAGHHAVLVGGAVRDALLGIEHGDWDVASSATPQEVQKLFRRTIPTGLEHGTVTVMSGRGDEREAVEVTTFRGEGAYHDGRRPSEVRFLRELEDDLARRDFTVNAFAWDPVQEQFTDCYNGLEDLNRGLIRAVGNAQSRFEEDGLRSMRAVRFAATLAFSLEPATEAAITPTLEIFDRVARERVRVELFKLLGAERPSVGLNAMRRSGLWPRVLIEYEEVEQARAVEACDLLPPDPCLRLARLLRPSQGKLLEAKAIEDTVERLKPSRDERERIQRLSSPIVEIIRESSDPVTWRRCAAEMGRRYIADALLVAEIEIEKKEKVQTAIEGVPLSVGELAIKGGELIQSGVIAKGPQVGECLRWLLKWVWDDPSRNQREVLLESARSFAHSPSR